MKILKLISNNFKRIRAVEIDPVGNIIMITGKNGQGKSSALDSITAALCGKDAIPTEPIRKGAKTASVTVNLDGDMPVTVSRSFTAAGSKLTVTDASGNLVGSPQTFVDRFLGKISFDPTRFLALDSREQRRTLLELLKIDFSDIDDGIVNIKADRAEIARDKRAVETNLAAMHFTEDLPDKEISVADLTTELKRRQEHNRIVKGDELKYDATVRVVGLLKTELGETAYQIEQLQIKMAELKETISGRESEADLLKANRRTVEDPDEILQQISESEATNQKIRVNLKIAELEKKVKGYQTEYYERGQTIDQLEASKQKLLTDAQMPVDGLTAGEEGLLYKGIPLEQASESEQLRVAVAIAMALNPTLRVIRSSANAFDSESLKIIQEMAEAHDYQVWLERVDESGKVGIVIEDGMIKE
jgi:DNA repair exonuclease SbcCD ATPase subunit